jgi:hypothetical protein
MNSAITEIFKNCESVDSFKKSVVEKDGDFDFSRDDMLDLGNEYFSRFPDSYSARNMQQVHYGYQIVRTCVAEKLINDFDGDRKSMLRGIFSDISSIDRVINEMIRKEGPGPVRNHYEKLSSKLDAIKKEIDSIPTGMIKERFVGGISSIYSIIYLIKAAIDKHEG